MPDRNLIARANVRVDAPPEEIWRALVDPEAVKQYMFGATVATDWRQGSAITWKGEWKGKPYEDKGELLRVEPGRLLQYSHYSPLSQLPDTPENYHTVTIELSPAGDQTLVSLTQDKNPTEEAREHSTKNWKTMLDGLRKYVEN